MQIEDIKTQSARIKDILASYSRVDNIKEYCRLVDAPEIEKSLFRRDFTDAQYRGIKLDYKVIKKHVQAIENSGSTYLKYDKTKGFHLIDYV